MSNLRYGWLPDLPDFRDHEFYGVTKISALPPAVDLRSGDSTPYNQGELSSCTGNAIASMVQFLKKKDAGVDFMPSRLFIYYNEREKEGTVNQDSGAYIRDGIKSVAKLGVCNESTWPYDKTQWATKPHDQAYTEALDHQAIAYKRLPVRLKSMKQCLADGYPFVFGFTVYDSFESEEVARTGIMPMAAKTEKTAGGHAVMAIGYNDEKKHVIVRNSWGVEWGDKGYFYMPYDYIENNNLCDDFWTIRKVEI